MIPSSNRKRTGARPGLGWKSAILLLLLCIPRLAFAALDFPAYPAKEVLPSCKKADFMTSSRARNAEEMIRKNNPETGKPNFAGKYLLVKIPYMMGTDWLMVDCESGAFLKDILAGEAEFKNDSFLVRITGKEGSEWKLWTGTTFVRAEEPKPDAPLPKDSSLFTRYESSFKEFAAEPVKTSCAPLKYSTYFRAQNAETHIKNRKPDLSRPNFAGSHLLVRVELLFETIYLIANCETGAFYQEYLSGDLTFRADSSLAILTKSGKAAELRLWHAPLWISRPDPTAAEGPVVFNELNRDEARSLIRLLPNPGHHSRIEFEDLVCPVRPISNCSFKDPGAKDPSARISLSSAPGPEVLEMLRRLGKAVPDGIGITRGFCVPEKSTCRLGLK